MKTEVQNRKILDISNILSAKDIKMLQNVGYIVLSGNLVKKVDNSQNFTIKKSNDILFLQLSN